MKRLIAVLLIFVIWQVSGSVRAAGFMSGIYEAEGSGFTYSGTWGIGLAGYQVLKTTTSTSATVAFTIDKQVCFVMIYYQSTAASGIDIDMDNAGMPLTTITVLGNSLTYVGYSIDLRPYNSFDIDFSMNMNSAGSFIFDRILTLDCIFTPVPTATAVTPLNTPVDTATAISVDATIEAMLTLIALGGGGVTPLPTWTALPTVTPQPTSTPAPTATPIGFVWSIDPAQQFVDVDGQPAALSLSASAGDAGLFTLIAAILVLLILNLAVVIWKR